MRLQKVEEHDYKVERGIYFQLDHPAVFNLIQKILGPSVSQIKKALLPVCVCIFHTTHTQIIQFV